MNLSVSHMISDAFSPLDDIVIQKGNYCDLYEVPTATGKSKIQKVQLVKPSILFQCLLLLIKLHRSFGALEKGVHSFTKKYKSTYLKNLTNSDYHKLRLLIDNYNVQFRDVFADTDTYKRHDHAIVRYYGNRLDKLRGLVFTTLSRIDKELTELYSPKRKSNYFSPVSEADRWKNRNAKSSYQM